jgi:uncharacterized protein YmfQ (DUF2313 family)
MLGFQPLGAAPISRANIWSEALALTVTEANDTFAGSGLNVSAFFGAIAVTEVNDSVVAKVETPSDFYGPLLATEANDIVSVILQTGPTPAYQDTSARVARRSDEDYTAGFFNLLPQGSAWPRLPDSVLHDFLLGLSGIWGQDDDGSVCVDGRAADLLQTEADPRATIEMLSDWEQAWGLPDTCLKEPLTIADRQKALINRYRMLGAQDPAFFVQQAADIGYAIKVEEHSPWTCGISQVGDTHNLTSPSINFRWELSGHIGPEIRFYWTVLVLNPRLSWFRADSGQCGVDPFLRVGLDSDLECLMNRLKPAHSVLRFDYSGELTQGQFAGTP